MEERVERPWEPKVRGSRGNQCHLDMSRPAVMNSMAAVVVVFAGPRKIRPVNSTAWMVTGSWASAPH